MKTRVQKLGDGLGLPLPSAITEQAGLTADAEVEVTLENGAVVVRPVAKPRFTLDELVSRITEENRHPEFADTALTPEVGAVSQKLEPLPH